MPTYDFACVACDERFDALVSFDAPSPPCPSCGEAGSERLISLFATSATSSQKKAARQRALVPALQSQGGHTHSGGCCGGGSCD